MTKPKAQSVDRSGGKPWRWALLWAWARRCRGSAAASGTQTCVRRWETAAWRRPAAPDPEQTESPSSDRTSAADSPADPAPAATTRASRSERPESRLTSPDHTHSPLCTPSGWPEGCPASAQTHLREHRPTVSSLLRPHCTSVLTGERSYRRCLTRWASEAATGLPACCRNGCCCRTWWSRSSSERLREAFTVKKQASHWRASSSAADTASSAQALTSRGCPGASDTPHPDTRSPPRYETRPGRRGKQRAAAASAADQTLRFRSLPLHQLNISLLSDTLSLYVEFTNTCCMAYHIWACYLTDLYITLWSYR